MGIYHIRAHHGMCLAFFQGKGYSEGFAEHMGRIKRELEENPKILLTAGTDDICSCCPHCVAGVCRSVEKTAAYDRKVLELCGLEPGAELEWKVFERLVKERILDRGKRKAVCGDCQWDSLC